MARPARFLVTVHGIGPYSASGGAVERLLGVLGPEDAEALRTIDFDWFQVVETERAEHGRLAQLSRALLVAAHISCDERRNALGTLVCATGGGLEFLLKAFLLLAPAFALLLAPMPAVYARFGEFAPWTDSLAAFAWAGVGTVGRWTLYAFGGTLGLVVLFALGGQRVPAATLLRRALLVVLQPILSVVFHLGTARASKLFRALALLLLAYGVLAYGLTACTPDEARQWSGNLGNVLATAGVFALVFLVAWGLSRVVAGPAKLARDVFNYIGDAQQRDTIQRSLERRLADIPDDAQVILLGRSLGSVIAVDSLCNCPAWGRFRGVSLVTGGSPIRRFFQTFFPGLYFPATSAATISVLQGRARVERWINVYRAGLLHGDPVGQSLFPRGLPGTDVGVAQRERRLLAAHYDYWGDERLIAEVRKAWMPAMARVESRPWAAPEPLRHARILDIASVAAKCAWIAGVAAGVVLSIVACFSIVAERRSTARTFMERVAVEGRVATARVNHTTDTWAHGELEFPVQIYQFEYEDSEQRSRSLSWIEDENSSFDGGLYFDSAAFRKSLGREDSSAPRTFWVDVLYLPDVPDRITLADSRFHARASGFPVFSLLWTGFGPIIGLILYIMFFAGLLARALALTLLPPEDFPDPWAYPDAE